MNDKRKELIQSCFEHLRGVFSQQQAFSITLGVEAINLRNQTVPVT